MSSTTFTAVGVGLIPSPSPGLSPLSYVQLTIWVSSLVVLPIVALSVRQHSRLLDRDRGYTPTLKGRIVRDSLVLVVGVVLCSVPFAWLSSVVDRGPDAIAIAKLTLSRTVEVTSNLKYVSCVSLPLAGSMAATSLYRRLDVSSIRAYAISVALVVVVSAATISTMSELDSWMNSLLVMMIVASHVSLAGTEWVIENVIYRRRQGVDTRLSAASES